MAAKTPYPSMCHAIHFFAALQRTVKKLEELRGSRNVDENKMPKTIIYLQLVNKTVNTKRNNCTQTQLCSNSNFPRIHAIDCYSERGPQRASPQSTHGHMRINPPKYCIGGVQCVQLEMAYVIRILYHRWQCL